jgi:hypothetical protein
MFVTGPPASAAPPESRPLMPYLTWTRHRSFGPQSERRPYDQAFRQAMLRYLEDMLRPFGVPYRPDCFDSGNQNCYSYLAEQLIACLPAASTREQDAQAGPGLVVIAHATADCEPGRSLSGYLTTLLPAEPLCFAISDQGELAPFSALELMRSFIVSGWPRTALVLVLDQSTLPYAARPEPDGPPADHAIGLLFASAPARAPASAPVGASRPLVAVRQRSGVAAGQLAETLAEMVGDLPSLGLPAGQVTLLAGAGLLAACEPESLARLVPAPPSGLRIRPVPAGPPCVGPWASLASLTGPGDDLAGLADDRMLVIEYDQALAAVAVAVFDAADQPSGVTPALEVIT